MNIQKTTRVLTTIFLVASFFWAWLWALTFWNRLNILRNRDGYSRATFEVTSVEYHEPSGYDDSPMPSYWANGVVNGQAERLSIMSRFESQPESLEQVQAAVPVGTVFQILYNPSLSRAIVQGETLRVIPFVDGFWVTQERLAFQIGKRMFLPLLLAIVAKILGAICIRSQNKSIHATSQ